MRHVEVLLVFLKYITAKQTFQPFYLMHIQTNIYNTHHHIVRILIIFDSFSIFVIWRMKEYVINSREEKENIATCKNKVT